jgi:hypothetical protein
MGSVGRFTLEYFWGCITNENLGSLRSLRFVPVHDPSSRLKAINENKSAQVHKAFLSSGEYASLPLFQWTL